MNFNIHGVKIKTDEPYFFPDYFLSDEEFEPDLTIDRVSYKNFDKSVHEKLGLQFWGGNNSVYFESAGAYKSFQKILVDNLSGATTFSFASRTLRHGIDDLIKMLFQIKLLQKNRTLVHAASLEKDGRGIIISGWPRTGKSSSALRLAGGGGYNILGDDMVILSADGMIYSFPKKAGVFYKSRYNLNLSRNERLSLLIKYFVARLLPPLHFLRFDRSARLDLGRFAKIKDSAELKDVCLVRKSSGEAKTGLSEDSAANKVLAHLFNIFYHSPFSKRLLLAYSLLNNEDPLYFETKSKEVIQNALKGKNCYLLRDKDGNFERHF